MNQVALFHKKEENNNLIDTPLCTDSTTLEIHSSYNYSFDSSPIIFGNLNDAYKFLVDNTLKIIKAFPTNIYQELYTLEIVIKGKDIEDTFLTYIDSFFIRYTRAWKVIRTYTKHLPNGPVIQPSANAQQLVLPNYQFYLRVMEGYNNPIAIRGEPNNYLYVDQIGEEPRRVEIPSTTNNQYRSHIQATFLENRTSNTLQNQEGEDNEPDPLDLREEAQIRLRTNLSIMNNVVDDTEPEYF